MAPILGILASQITGHLVTNSFESIATVNVGAGGTSTITFSSIPQTYKHLQIRAVSQSSPAWNFVTFNNDATQGNYYAHELIGSGTLTSQALAGGSAPKGIQLFVQYNNTNTFSGIIIDILDYTNTNKAKTLKCLSGWDFNGSGEIRLTSGLWSATPAAITSLSIVTNNGNYGQYTKFALYGIKG